MRRSLRKFLASYCLIFATSSLFAACSLVVDFPKKSDDSAADDDNDTDDDDDRPDASTMDGSSGEDAATERDGRVDATRPDSGGGECQQNSGCDNDELCCDRKDGKGGVCVASTKDECAVCGEACNSAAAPNCSNRRCECRAGTGDPCPRGQTCLGTGASARCVECTQNSDCSDSARPLCEDNECVQCSRGANASNAADDEGCSGNTPICGTNNTCVACSTSPNNCPNNQQCVGGVGCVGCSPTAAIGSNGCTRTAPVCRPVGTMFQCGKCERNADCGNGFCDTVTGACVNECAPQAPVGSNGCSGGTPFCKFVGSDYECAPCSATDCMSGRFCATGDHPRAGNCVQCRTNADCPDAAPMCNRTTGMCTGCTGDRDVFDNATGQCVECVADANCTPAKGGAYCHPTQKTCVQCSMLPMPNNACMTRNPATPMCGSSGMCVGCAEDDDCNASSTTPLCISGMCVACTAAGGNMGDMRCSQIGMNEVCLQSGACSRCDPADDDGCRGMTPVCSAAAGGNQCVRCVVATDEGCEGLTPQCVMVGNALTCAACDPGTPTVGCAAGTTCMLVAGVPVCSPIPIPDGGLLAP